MNIIITVHKFIRETNLVIDNQGYYFANLYLDEGNLDFVQIYEEILKYLEENKIESKYKRGDKKAFEIFRVKMFGILSRNRDIF